MNPNARSGVDSPMDKNLGVISVASPCSERWEAMTGDAQVRHCGKCDKNVYSLDTLSTDEIRALVVRTEGKICWRFFVRKDGTVLTRDCPVGVRRARQRVIAALATACTLLLAGVAGVLREAGYWDASQVLGSLSYRLSPSCQLPAPLIAADHLPRGKSMGGKREVLPNDKTY